MEAHIDYLEDYNGMKAYVDTRLVATCFETGSISYWIESGKRKIKHEYINTSPNEDEMLQNFVKFCEKQFAQPFEVIRHYKYHIKFSDGVEFDIHALNDDDAIQQREGCFNANPATITRGDRIIAENLTRKPIEVYTARKTWKYRDRINPRGKFYL